MPKFKIIGIKEPEEFKSMADACTAYPGCSVERLRSDDPRLIGLPMEPLGNRIFVERFGREQKTAGGLYIPDSAQSDAAEGTVIACGPGKQMDDGTILKMQVKVGDKVFFAKYSGSEIKIDGRDCLIMTDAEIIARLK